MQIQTVNDFIGQQEDLLDLDIKSSETSTRMLYSGAQQIVNSTHERKGRESFFENYLSQGYLSQHDGNGTYDNYDKALQAISKDIKKSGKKFRHKDEHLDEISSLHKKYSPKLIIKTLWNYLVNSPMVVETLFHNAIKPFFIESLRLLNITTGDYRQDIKDSLTKTASEMADFANNIKEFLKQEKPSTS